MTKAKTIEEFREQQEQPLDEQLASAEMKELAPDNSFFNVSRVTDLIFQHYPYIYGPADEDDFSFDGRAWDYIDEYYEEWQNSDAIHETTKAVWRPGMTYAKWFEAALEYLDV